LRSIEGILADAVTNAELFYINPKQEILKTRLENNMDVYRAQLTRWYDVSKEQLSLEFVDMPMTTLNKSRREKKESIIETILNEKSQFYKDLTSLDNYPYLKLLAVFFK